jgi:CMP-N,N'-diacetyllegionaminic acid synthase
MKILTIIPARSGSKGIPFKNRVPVYGKPLIAWTIECALCTEGLDRIIVSTDDTEILSIAQGYKRVVPMCRPERLAKDETPISAVIEYLLIQEAEANQGPYDAVLLLQPTAPIREPRHISGALQALKPSVNSVVSVVAIQDMHPARMYHLLDRSLLKPMFADYEHARRQDIPPAYFRNGSIYLVRTEAFRRQNTLIAKPTAGYQMEEKLLLNIDEPRDMIIAGALVAAWQKGDL